MVKIIKKILPCLLLWVGFVVVILQVSYPPSLIQSQLSQLLLFFIPLFLALTTTLNLFLKNTFLSLSISLGLLFLLVLKALDTLNLVTTILILIAVGLLISYFKKKKHKSLTNYSKIPKLTRLKKGN